MVGPDAFTEVRCLAHAKQMQALAAIPRVAGEFRQVFGRTSGGLVHPYACEDAETIVVALGSVFGTVCDIVDEMREGGVRTGALAITSFRPFPLDAVREVLGGARQVVVLERALAVGIGGIVSATFDEVVEGLDESTALFEARRCMSCGNCFECDNCYSVCPDNAITKLGPGRGFAIDLDYCKGCGLCAAECPSGAIEMVPKE
ncbi:4Fe-4S binding protein [Streptomyces sasae]|uniref:4Fe-4S binding protein n=1 Tax=Streptomyces sasae TaxID=1266772 RepID=UPI0029313DC5|nr:4Fe-4S binding protein [Streptomyces sasae]